MHARQQFQPASAMSEQNATREIPIAPSSEQALPVAPRLNSVKAACEACRKHKAKVFGK
jgi:hypothetical protein